MRKWLSFLGAITLLGTSTTSLVACNNIPQYNEDELQQIKKENQINTNFQEIKENLEWICPQEQPFNTVDNKYYFVVCRGNENDVWEIVKFKNDTEIYFNKWKKIKEFNNFDIVLCYTTFGNNLAKYKTAISGIYKPGITGFIDVWENINNYIKAVYRWNGDEQKLPDLIVDNNGNVKVNSE
ncbi:lipoprotein [Spiroplasma citri]|uniref:Lipoprotein n=1 Tax=Spiroplasma citri TaxID=2133 RepID=A0AAX3SZJ2_SPICI|nr:lipoprotein [Spiroplasma citri]WFG96622.1 lipoprotein [Spiroplasma citri]WFH00514.1 lipoprotein [Spiroplasma citri]